MLPVNAVILSANCSSRLARRFSCWRCRRKASIFLRRAEFNSPGCPRSSALCLDVTGSSARYGRHRCQVDRGNTLVGCGEVAFGRCVILQIIVIEVGKPRQGIPVPDLQASRVPFDELEMPQLLDDTVGVNA